MSDTTERQQRNVALLDAYGCRFERLEALIDYLGYVALGDPSERDVRRIEIAAAFLITEIDEAKAEIEQIEGAHDE